MTNLTLLLILQQQQRSLTELNLRRNAIERVLDLDALPNLQRVFLSHNNIQKYDSIGCVFRCIRTLSELALSENPIVGSGSGGGLVVELAKVAAAAAAGGNFTDSFYYFDCTTFTIFTHFRF